MAPTGPGDGHDPPSFELVAGDVGHPVGVRVLPKLAVRVLGVFNPMFRELVELSYEFDESFVLDTSKYESTFDTGHPAERRCHRDRRLVSRPPPLRGQAMTSTDTDRFRQFSNPATGESIQVAATAQDGEEDLVRFNWRSRPGGSITEHLHPHQEERFMIAAGEGALHG